MFTMNNLSFVVNLIVFGSVNAWYIQLVGNPDGPKVKRTYWTSRISYDLFYGLTAFMHLIFVVKYWLLSRKLSGQNAERCAQIWFYSLTLMIVGTAIADLTVTWSDYDLNSTKYSKAALLSVTGLMYVPEILTVYLLFDALSTIKQRSEMVISTRQVFL